MARVDGTTEGGKIMIRCPHCGELVDIQETVERLMAAACDNAVDEFGNPAHRRKPITNDPRIARPL